MRSVFLIIIRIYWITVPESKRRSCLFKESCSRFVYRITLTEGLKEGLLALKKRFHQCRPGYKLYRNEKQNAFELLLKDGTLLKKEEISPNVGTPEYIKNFHKRSKLKIRQRVSKK